MLTAAAALMFIAAQKSLVEPEPGLAKLASLMEGSFSSEVQAVADHDFYDIRLEMKRIWEGKGDGGVWLYVEQATATALDKPYRQRVYHLTSSTYRSGDGAEKRVYVSEVWMLPGDPLVYAGAAADPSKLDKLTPAELSRRDGCEVWLVMAADGTFAGSTLGVACGSDRQGAVYASSMVKVNPEGLTTWDRGFDASGKQVWGSVKGAYEFKRRRAE